MMSLVGLLPQSLVDALRSHAEDPRRFVDAWTLVEFRRFPQATPVQIARAEDRVGFPLPAALRAVYLAVGNGGFGPGYEILGVDDGAADDEGHNLEQVYEHLSAPDPEVPGWEWRKHTVPFCYLGCQVYSCVGADGLVVDLDGYEWADSGISLVEWLSRWANGQPPRP